MPQCRFISPEGPKIQRTEVELRNRDLIVFRST